MYKIGHGATSSTGVPTVSQLRGSERYLIDCPGFGDSDIFKEFPNQTMIHHLLLNAKSVTICMVIKGSTIEASRGAQYLQTMTSVLRMLSEHGVANSETFLVPIITNPNNFRSARALESALSKPIELMHEKIEAMNNQSSDLAVLAQYQGPHYPGPSELEPLSKLLDAVLTNYRVVSPTDDKNEFANFPDRFILIEQLHQELLSKQSDSKDDLAFDLPLALLDFFEIEVFSKLLYAKGFQTSANIQ